MQRMRYFVKRASLGAMSGTILYGGGCFLTTDEVANQLSISLQSLITGLFGAVVKGAFDAFFPA